MSDEQKQAPRPAPRGSDFETEQLRLERAKLENENLKLQSEMLDRQQKMLDANKPPDARAAELYAANVIETQRKKYQNELEAGPRKFWVHLDKQLPSGRELHEPWLLVGAEHAYHAIEKYKEHMGIITIGAQEGERTPDVQVVEYGTDARPSITESVHVAASRKRAEDRKLREASIAGRRKSLTEMGAMAGMVPVA